MFVPMHRGAGKKTSSPNKEPERRDAHFPIHNLVFFFSRSLYAVGTVFIQFSCLIWLWTNYCLLPRTQDGKKLVLVMFSCFLLRSCCRDALGLLSWKSRKRLCIFHVLKMYGWCLFNRHRAESKVRSRRESHGDVNLADEEGKDTKTCGWLLVLLT